MPKRKPRTDLTSQEIKFAQLYLSGPNSGNATQSYIEAGLRHKDQSENAASVAASGLLGKSHIRDYLDDLRSAASEAAKITVEGLARGFARAERANLAEVYGADGMILPFVQWPEHIQLSVIRYETEEMFERVENPEDSAGPKIKKLVGVRYKVWLENKTECRKVLAEWLQMIGKDAKPSTPPKPDKHVVNGPDISKLAGDNPS